VRIETSQNNRGFVRKNPSQDITRFFHPLMLSEDTIVAFKVIIGHHAQIDCARDSVKTSSNSQNSNQSDVFKNGTSTFEHFEINANFRLHGSHFLQFPENFLKFLSRFHVNILQRRVAVFRIRGYLH